MLLVHRSACSIVEVVWRVNGVETSLRLNDGGRAFSERKRLTLTPPASVVRCRASYPSSLRVEINWRRRNEEGRRRGPPTGSNRRSELHDGHPRVARIECKAADRRQAP